MLLKFQKSTHLCNLLYNLWKSYEWQRFENFGQIMAKLKTKLFIFVKPFPAKPHNLLSWNLNTLFVMWIQQTNSILEMHTLNGGARPSFRRENICIPTGWNIYPFLYQYWQKRYPSIYQNLWKRYALLNYIYNLINTLLISNLVNNVNKTFKIYQKLA